MARGVIAIALAAVTLVSAAPAQAGAVRLEIRADTGPGSAPRSATLTCDARGPRATGFLRRRDPARLCRRAYAIEAFLGRPPRSDRACTEQYGGPDHARVRGSVRATAVDRRFARRDGCEIADWDRAQLLLPRPTAAG